MNIDLLEMINRIILLVFIANFSLGHSQKLNTINESLVLENHQSILDTLVPKLLEKFKVPAAGVGIISNGEIVFDHVYGEHQLGKKAPSNTIFNVASITKSVVALTTMKLVQNGDWNIDEPLANYFTDPDVVNDSRSKDLTTRHVLSHTTGFKNWRWHEKDKKLQFNFDPGTQYQYSGEGMEYLRKAIEKKFGIGLEKIVDSLVFQPLKMENTTLNWIADKDTLHFAKWHDTFGKLHNVDHRTPETNAADDLLITISDMLKFDMGVIEHQILDDKFQTVMLKPQIQANKNVDQSLGWVVLKNQKSGIYLINHDGGDTGVVATNIIFPNTKDAICIFTNGNNGASVTNMIIKEVILDGLEVIKKLRWENEMPEIVNIKREDLKKISGIYKTDRGFDIEFKLDGNHLMTESEVYPRQTLFAKSETEFFPLPFEVYFVFTETEEGMTMKLLNPDKSKGLQGIRD